MTEETIFANALEKSTPEERAAFLDQACAGHAALRGRVEALLASHADPSFLRAPAVHRQAPAVDEAQGQRDAASNATNAWAGAVSEAGTVLAGRYKLLEPIGEGGMGSVWMADQSEPVKRRVAVKLIKPGMDSRQVLVRFEAERQALALMDHPNIARVLDGGATADGRPYFVMELVKGVPLTAYCDDKRLGVRDRLALFADVCRAVQHAHQKGIIHRDLKPSNVLVAPYDGKPVVKVIDFGIAKATGQSLTDKTLFTGFGAVVGTPEYMSPEQAEVNNADIDTRSDVYSLGVLLYELLTGTTPLTRQRVKEAALLEVLRLVREEEPPRPSTRLSTTEGLAATAAVRGEDPGRLTKLVRGELDWIVMKALEKDRARRYETANGLAAEIDRYLAGEPVQAVPPSAGYRLRKFLRRNKVTLLATGFVTMALLIGTIVSIWQAIRATRAEHEAESRRVEAEDNHQKARQAIDEYFTLVSESKLLDIPGLQPLRKSLLDSANRYYRKMAERRRTDPAALTDVALAYLRFANISHEVGNNNDGLNAIQDALNAVDTLRREHPQAREQVLRLGGHWKVSRPMSLRTEMPKDVPAADRILTRFLQLWETLAAENPSAEGFQCDLGHLYRLIGTFEGGRGYAGDQAAFERAVATMNKAVAIWDRLSRAHPENRHFAENLAGTVYLTVWLFNNAGRKQESEAAEERALALYEKFASQYPDTSSYREGLARSLFRTANRLKSAGRHDEAIVRYDRAFKILVELAENFPVTPGHSDLLSQIASGLMSLVPESQQHMATCLSKIINKNPDNSSLWYRRGGLYLAMGQTQLAEENFTRALELAPDAPEAPWIHHDRSFVYRSLKRDAEALADLNHATQRWPKLWDTWVWRGNWHRDHQEWHKAVADYTQGLTLNPNYQPAWENRGIAHVNLRQWEAAIRDFSKAAELAPENIVVQKNLSWLLATCPEENLRDAMRAIEFARKAAAKQPKNGAFQNTLGVALYRTGDWKGAIQTLTRSCELTSGGNAFDWYFLAMAHHRLGQKDEARKWYDRAAEWQTKNRPSDEELIRFRAEAAELLGIPIPPVRKLDPPPPVPPSQKK